MRNSIVKLSDLEELHEKVLVAEKEYKYQPVLTKKLDALDEDFTEITLMEIVLWKVNRFPEINTEIIGQINDLRKDYSDSKGRNTLRNLLVLKGFDLPMASTVLRFAVPSRLQIIDQRVYRFIMQGADCLNIPYNLDKKVELYFEYIDKLHEVCEVSGIPFEKSDRILYQLDKIYNKGIQLKTSNAKGKQSDV